MPIPTEINFSNVLTGIIDISDAGLINLSINSVKAQMLSNYWTLTGGYYATTTLSCPGLVGTSIVGFSIVLINFHGTMLQFFTPPEPDPTGNPSGLPGIFITGIPAVAGDDQGDLIVKLANKMNEFSLPDFECFVEDIDTISYTATNPGPDFNEISWISNLIGGFSWNGATRGGGWALTSMYSIQHSQVSVSLRNKDARTYFSIDAEMNGNVCSEILLQRRGNYLSIVSPFGWNLFHKNDGTSYSSGDVYPQVNNYLIGTPELLAQETNEDLADPLVFCAFVLIRDRDAMNQAGYGVVCINEDFHDGTFSAFDSDVGISIPLLNSRLHSAGELVTTSGKFLQIQAMAALSKDAGEPLTVIGPVWDMLLTSKYFPLDQLSLSNTGKKMIAYRSQQAPCEWTLWHAIE